MKTGEPFHILIAAGDLRTAVEKQIAKWPAESRPSLPGLLRDMAEEIEIDLEPPREDSTAEIPWPSQEEIEESNRLNAERDAETYSRLAEEARQDVKG